MWLFPHVCNRFFSLGGVLARCTRQENEETFSWSFPALLSPSPPQFCGACVCVNVSVLRVIACCVSPPPFLSSSPLPPHSALQRQM